MNKHQMNQKKYPITYNLYGIYVDWQIDNYQSFIKPDSNGINNFKDFQDTKGWKVVKLMRNGEKMVTLDIDFPNLKLLKMIGIQPEKVLKDKMCAADAEKLLYSYMKENKVPYFDIFEYYMDNAPWNLKGGISYNKNHTNSPSTEILLNMDADIFDKRIIVKVMTEKGEERITSVSDIYNGGVDEYEYLIDATCYDEENSLLMEQSWSNKLGIPVLKSDESIDFNYIYHV